MILFCLPFSPMIGRDDTTASPSDCKIVTEPCGLAYANSLQTVPGRLISQVLYSGLRMSVVFVIASDWRLRAAVRAELRELGINALGIDLASDAGRAIASGQMPSAMVLEATAAIVGNPALQKLIGTVPTILVASRTETVPSPPPCSAALSRSLQSCPVSRNCSRATNRNDRPAPAIGGRSRPGNRASASSSENSGSKVLPVQKTSTTGSVPMFGVLKAGAVAQGAILCVYPIGRLPSVTNPRLEYGPPAQFTPV